MSFFSFPTSGQLEVPLISCVTEPCPGAVADAISFPQLSEPHGAKNIALSSGELIGKLFGLFGSSKEQETEPPADTVPNVKDFNSRSFFNEDALFALIVLALAVGAIAVVRRL